MLLLLYIATNLPNLGSNWEPPSADERERRREEKNVWPVLAEKTEFDVHVDAATLDQATLD